MNSKKTERTTTWTLAVVAIASISSGAVAAVACSSDQSTNTNSAGATGGSGASGATPGLGGASGSMSGSAGGTAGAGTGNGAGGSGTSTAGGTSGGGTGAGAGGSSTSAGGSSTSAGGSGGSTGGGSGTGGASATLGCHAPTPNATVGNACHNAAPPALKLTQVATGLASPTFVTQAPGDPPTRLLALEQAGKIRVIKDGALDATPFLDITSLVKDKGLAGEQGLLGLAFAPNFAQSGRFWVYYNDKNTTNGDKVLAEYKATPGGVADPASGKIVLKIPHPEALRNHNGGMLAFSPKDNCLYVAVGDGGGAGDPNGHGQSVTEQLGSILRIDVDKYPTAAPGNLTSGGADPHVWDYGLRNPWRFSFDRTTGDFYIGDVGQDAYEEVDVEPAGKGQRNYGWNVMEGKHCFSPATGCDQSGKTLPAAEQPQAGTTNTAMIGGYVYRGSKIPDMVGRYIYGDYGSRRIWTFTYSGETAGQPTVCDEAELTALKPGGGIVAFGEDVAGELYVLGAQGVVYRIDPG